MDEQVLCLDCDIDLTGCIEVDGDDVPVCSACAEHYDWHAWNTDYNNHEVDTKDWSTTRYLYRLGVPTFLEEIEHQECYERQLVKDKDQDSDYHEGYANGLKQAVTLLKQHLATS